MGKVVCYKMNIKIFNTPKQVSNELSSYIISKYILRRKNIAISGGSTPIMLFKEISKKLKKTEKIESNFYWIDERCVLPKSKESNFKTANNYLFNKINIDKKNIYRIKGENNPNDEQRRYTEILKNNLESINKLPSIDLTEPLATYTVSESIVSTIPKPVDREPGSIPNIRCFFFMIEKFYICSNISSGNSALLKTF